MSTLNLSTLNPLNSALGGVPSPTLARRALDATESELSRSEAVLLIGAFAALAASMLSFTTL